MPGASPPEVRSAMRSPARSGSRAAFMPPSKHRRRTLSLPEHLPKHLPEHLDDQLALVAAAAVLEQVQALPRAQAELPVDDRHPERGLRERRLEVRRHIVEALVVVGVARIALGA